MASVLELLRGRLQQRAGNAEDLLAQAARDHAAGQPVDISAVEQAIVETGRSLDDFAQFCDIAAKRRAALADLERMPAASGRLKKALAAIEAEQKRYEEIRNAHVERITELDGDRAEAQTAVTKGESAREVLLDPKLVLGTLKARYEKAISDRVEAAKQVSALERELKEARVRVKDEEEWLAQVDKPSGLSRMIVGQDAETEYRVQDHVNAKARAERRVAELEPQLKAATTALDTARRALAAVELEVVKN